MGIIKKGKQGLFRLTVLSAFLLSGAALYAEPVKENILKSTGARASGMAGAFTAVADDYSAFYWNPAGLVLMDRITGSVFFDSVYHGKQTDFGFNYTHPVMDTMSAAFTYYKGIYADSKYADDILYFSFASFLDAGKKYALGANLKFNNTGLTEGPQSYGRGGGLDMGLMIFPDFLEKKMRFGFLAQDMESVIEWNNGTKQRVPLLFKMAVSYSIDPTAIVALDIDMLQYTASTREARTGVHLGGEKWFLLTDIGNFGVRGGFMWREAMEQNHRFTFGLSYGREDFVADYVYILPVGDFGESHKLNFSWFFAPRQKYEYKEPSGDGVVKVDGKAKELKITADEQAVEERYKYMELWLSNKYLSPNKDTVQDSVELRLKNMPPDPEGAQWSLSFINAAGAAVYDMNGKLPLPESFTWTGETKDGGQANDGDYAAVFSVYYGGVEVWKKARVVTVDTGVPQFDANLYPKVFAPHKKSAVKELNVDIQPNITDVKSWTFTVQDSAGQAVRRISGDGFARQISWNGRDASGNTVKDGKYRVELILRDFAGNKYGITEPFTVDTYVAGMSVKPGLRIFSAGKQTVSFEPDFPEPARIKSWDLEIYAPDGSVIKSWKDRNMAVKNITWDGTDNLKNTVRAGTVYRYRCTALQKNGISTEDTGFIQSALPEFKDAGIELTLAAVDFEKGDIAIPAGEYGYLNQAAEAIKKYARDYFVYIKSYSTDDANPEKNVQLSVSRAAAVMDYLVNSQGVPAKNIYCIGYGDGEYVLGTEIKQEMPKTGGRVEVDLLTR
ncbi:MAG: OmpA family protein [Spirochaetia bacterium]|nr:OmpA family protein [Spirochaetia bacterium]